MNRPDDVSVITPAFNVAYAIERAIRSVAGQQLPVLQHIVIDDGSTDDTVARVMALQRELPHLVLLQQAHRGAAHARNAGIDHASGRYIAFLDGDDWWRPAKLAHQIGFMRTSGAVFSYGDYEAYNSVDDERTACYVTPESLGYADLLDGCPVGNLTAAYDQHALGKHYMAPVFRGHDWGLWLSLTRNGQRALKYPGNDAVYVERHQSLSSAKCAKARDIMAIYRRQENLGRMASLLHLGRHIVASRRKHKRARRMARDGRARRPLAIPWANAAPKPRHK